MDEGTCDLGLVLSVAEYLGIGAVAAGAIVKEVAPVTSTWRDVARAAGAKLRELDRMASASLTRALAR